MSIRNRLALTLLVCFGPSVAVGAPSTEPEPLRVGAPLTVKRAVDIDRLAKDPKRYVGRTLRIEGVVKNVCQGTGCWVEVVSPKGATFLAKSLDESVLLPMDCIGRKVVVQGVVTMVPAKGAEAHHHAEHAADGHTCPAPSYLLSTQGVELAAAKKD